MVSSLVNAGKETRSITITGSAPPPRRRYYGQLRNSGKRRRFGGRPPPPQPPLTLPLPPGVMTKSIDFAQSLEPEVLENMVEPLVSMEGAAVVNNLVYSGGQQQIINTTLDASMVYFNPEALDNEKNLEDFEAMMMNLDGGDGLIERLVNEQPMDELDEFEEYRRISARNKRLDPTPSGEDKDVLEMTEEEQREKRKTTCLEKSFFYAFWAATSTSILLSLVGMLLSLRWN